jgi:hypothetical protein
MTEYKSSLKEQTEDLYSEQPTSGSFFGGIVEKLVTTVFKKVGGFIDGVLGGILGFSSVKGPEPVSVHGKRSLSYQTDERLKIGEYGESKIGLEVSIPDLERFLVGKKVDGIDHIEVSPEELTNEFGEKGEEILGVAKRGEDGTEKVLTSSKVPKVLYGIGKKLFGEYGKVKEGLQTYLKTHEYFELKKEGLGSEDPKRHLYVETTTLDTLKHLSEYSEDPEVRKRSKYGYYVGLILNTIGGDPLSTDVKNLYKPVKQIGKKIKDYYLSLSEGGELGLSKAYV